MASRFSSRVRIIALAAWHSIRTLGRRKAPTHPRRILIAHHLLLGDTLMLTPLLAKLRELHPTAEIVMTAPRAIAPLYEMRPYGVRAIPYDPRDPITFEMLHSLRGFDLAIVPGDNRHAWLARALGAGWVVAHAGDRPAYKDWAVDERVPYPTEPAAWGDMVAALATGEPPVHYRPTDWPQPTHAAFRLPETPYCVLHVGASSPLKLWNNEKWLALAEYLSGFGYQVVWSGGKGEDKHISAIDPQQKFISCAGKLDLPQVWHLIKHAALLVCPDTGIAHLGRLVNTPTITLFGPGSDIICGAGNFWRNAPYRTITVPDFRCRNQHKLFRREIAWVQRCGRSPDECGTPACMHAITLDTVKSAARDFLHSARLTAGNPAMPPNSTPQATDEKICHQINFSEVLGGAEIYTHFFSKALLAKGWKTVLYVNKKASFWNEMDLTGVELIPLDRKEDIPSALPKQRSLVVTHTPVSGVVANVLRQNHLLAGIIHHPIYGGNGEPYRAYQLLFAVSRHVINTLDAANITHYYPHPLYGIADLDRLKRPDNTSITATPMYEWDKRKLRDQLLSITYPIFWKAKPTRHFSKREGLTLGFVSRIAPAKQFPEMFEIIAPILRRFPQVHLEFFGSGVGYSPVKKLKKSLAPIRKQVRFWGPQTNLNKVYHSMDFLMAGLPEREAMGLNILEAEFCGTPVLAVNAPPFNEIIRDGGTGFLYTDPRQDDGKNFEALLGKLIASPALPNPLKEKEFIDFFSFEAFSCRVDMALRKAEYTQPEL